MNIAFRRLAVVILEIQSTFIVIYAIKAGLVFC